MQTLQYAIVMEPRCLPEKPNPFCIQCYREVPLTPAIAVIVTNDGSLVGYLHEFRCRERWQETHRGYAYGVVPEPDRQ
jgi:hypothetical protein